MSTRLDLAALRRTAREPVLFGSQLARLRERDGLTIEQQSEQMGLSLSDLAYVGYCIWTFPDRPIRETELIDMMAFIAKNRRCDTSKLLEALRPLV